MSADGGVDFDPQRLATSTSDLDHREVTWLRLYRHYGPRLESFFAARVPPGHSIDGIVAEIWRRALMNIGSLRSSRAMWSWLTTIGNNLLRDLERRDRVARTHEVLWSDIGERDRLRGFVDAWSATDLDRQAIVERCADVLDRLSPEEREFLELYAVDNLTHEEIASRLALPSAAASRKRLQRLRSRFEGG